MAGFMRAVVLLDGPKSEFNVANAYRNCAAFGASELVVCERRYRPATGAKGDRLPRPLRMKAYRQSVGLRYLDRFSLPEGLVPVVVEIIEGAVPLYEYSHPERACYVFGPEDGSVRPVAATHDRVYVPAAHCLNLAQTVGLVLYERNRGRSYASLEKVSSSTARYSSGMSREAASRMTGLSIMESHLSNR